MPSFTTVMTAQAIGLAPLLTEKSVKLQQIANTVTFRVRPKATKGQIAMAVHELYKIKPVKIRTALMSPKSRTRGKTSGWTNIWKKAFVTLPAGKSIDFTV